MVSFEEDPKRLMDDWPYWRDRVIQLAKIESATRPYLRKILASLAGSVANEEGISLIHNLQYAYIIYGYILATFVFIYL